MIRACLLSGEEQPFGDAGTIFTEPILADMRKRFHSEVLTTQVYFTEKLSNRVLAACLVLGESCIIAINARFKADPETLAHTLLEEFTHVHQVYEGVDFEAQRSAFAYTDRPYEVEAKRIATEILGYEPGDYDVYLIREEPPGPLYDRPAETT